MMAASSKAYVYPKHILFFLVVHKWYEQRAHTKKTFSLIFFISTFVDWGYKTATALKALSLSHASFSYSFAKK